ncbi:MAG: PrsW family intramembrane metalloprotease [Bacteroidetes bacterium]|nr:PrsW family intramembrane metalloprotease [Bacteroidota bacterium]
MTSDQTMIIGFAALIGVLYLMKIRSYDMYEKEPLLTLLAVAIFGGITAIAISLFLYDFVEVRHNFLDAVFKIGLIEEASKLLALMFVYLFIRKDFNEIVDGIIYITAISLGFAVIENVFYALKDDQAILTIVMRSLTAVIGHIAFSGYMGAAFIIHVKIHRNYSGLLLALALSALAHGLYDGVLFHERLNFLFIFVFIVLVMGQLWMLKILLGFSAFREELTDASFTETGETVSLHCPHCALSEKPKAVQFWNIRAAICDFCGHLLVHNQNIRHLTTYFRPALNARSFTKQLTRKNRSEFLDSNQKILFDAKSMTLCAKPAELGTWLAGTNIADRERILGLPLVGFILKHLGMRYLMPLRV